MVIGGAYGSLWGFALIVIGLVGPTPLAIVGAVTVVIGVVWNVRTMMQARRVVREHDRLSDPDHNVADPAIWDMSIRGGSPPN